VLAVLAALPLTAAAAPRPEIHYVMGTYFRITADEDARPAMRACFREARRLERVFSRFDPASELSRVHAGGSGPVAVSVDFARLLARARALTVATAGAFDVSLGALTELWRRPGVVPSDAELVAARAGVGGVELRTERLHLAPGTRLDFDGIAKGWAVDACVGILRAAGVRRALVSLGESSLYALGAPPDARHWTLAVRGIDPERAIGTLRLRDQAASVSATVGSRGPHIVDPGSGRLLAEKAVAVVVAGSAADAEAYSKALLVWGGAGVGRVEELGATGAVHFGAAGARHGAEAHRARLFVPLGSAVLNAGAAGKRG
jgi:thiamine biosynthesis lipoprotein